MAEARGVSNSEFNMWRAVFAFALVDNVLSIEEQDLLHSYLATVPFSPVELKTLRDDFNKKQDVEAMYKRITEQADKSRFCVFARALVWSDGDMDQQEASILKRVACMGDCENKEVLSATRAHEHLHHYYQEYSKAGLMAFFKPPPEVSVEA